MLAHEPLKGHEQVAPAVVAQLGGLAGRVDDVDEHDGGEHPVRLRPTANPGQELLDLVEDGVGVVTERQMILARQLHVPGAGNAAGEEATGVDVDGLVTPRMQDQGGDLDGGQHVADVDVTIHSEQTRRRGWTGAVAQ